MKSLLGKRERGPYALPRKIRKDEDDWVKSVSLMYKTSYAEKNLERGYEEGGKFIIVKELQTYDVPISNDVKKMIGGAITELSDPVQQ